VCSENSCDRKKPEYYDNVWSYDFLTERLENGGRVRLPVVIDEYTIKFLGGELAKYETWENSYLLI
jgi:hypothetical protein